MINASKQMNIISLIKFILLSLIFCLPRTPIEIEHDASSIKSISQTNIYSFLIPSNNHFEHKVLKKIPFIECFILIGVTYFASQFDVLNNLTSYFAPIRTGHYIISSLARGPPTLS